MGITTSEARNLLQKQARVPLGFLPTPLTKLEKLSDQLGVDLYIKRDDFTGSNLFGGNKTRKLEFLLGKAKAEGAEYVFTYGATQSNHAMQTTWAAVKNGLKPVLYLVAVVAPDENDYKANLFLDSIYGAEIHIVYPNEGESFIEAEERSFQMGKDHIARLEAEGHKCYDVPMGGANEYGSLGYINAMVEIQDQSSELGIDFDYLYHSTGSGGTMAGIVAGRKLLGMTTEIHSISALGGGEAYENGAVDLANKSLGLLGVNPLVTRADLLVDMDHIGPGYEMPSEEGTEAIKLLAREEAILVDPVYSGKAFAGLLADIRSGVIPAGSKVLFLHTGGATVFFAEKEILGQF